MQIHSVGIDLGKTTFHLVALGCGWQGARAEEVHAKATFERSRRTCRLR